MEFKAAPSHAQRQSETYVMLTYTFGYDQEGNYHKSAIAGVSVYIDGQYQHGNSKTAYSAEAKEWAADKAEKLGLNFVYYKHA